MKSVYAIYDDRGDRAGTVVADTKDDATAEALSRWGSVGGTSRVGEEWAKV